LKKVVFVAPHPDDETLGCGGTILKHGFAGDELYWLIATNVFETCGYGRDFVERRGREIETVARHYGFKGVFKLDFPTTELDTISRNKLIGAIGNVMQEVMPHHVYLPFRNDVHSDHKITFDAVMSSIKTFRCPSIGKVSSYETISETEFAPPLIGNCFTPNSFSDISDYMDEKITIMSLYESEMGEHPFPRSEANIRALATFRGASAGVGYAEAFMLIKEIW
jgi:LmbE family N-acetylglucosaminyl deacetylase